MFEIHCSHCQADYIVGPRSLLALAGEKHALRGVARCPLGHHVEVDFSLPARREVPTAA